MNQMLLRKKRKMKKSNDKIEVKKDEEINGNIFELKNEQDSDEDSVYIIKRQKNYKK